MRKNRIGLVLNEFMKNIHIEPFTVQCGYRAGYIRSMLKERGTPIGPFDLLIGASALEKNYALVTSNIVELSRIKDLQVVNWRRLIKRDDHTQRTLLSKNKFIYLTDKFQALQKLRHYTHLR